MLSISHYTRRNYSHIDEKTIIHMSGDGEELFHLRTI